MTNFLLKVFAKDPTTDRGRSEVGALAGAVGIFCNLLLSCWKVIAGLLSGSVAIGADGLNNLSDAASSIVTLIGFRFARRPADAHHPFGHARAEYLTGLWVAVLIVFLGVELAKSSLDKILRPVPVEVTLWTVGVLLASIGVKVWMFRFLHRLGELIGSAALEATAVDSRNDVLATCGVLLGCLAKEVLDWNIDGWVGMAVAIFVLKSGFSMAKETMSPLLGESADPELVEKLQRMVLSHEGILGIHDLLVHDYGPGRCFASAHVELSAEEDPLRSHERIDHLECDALEELGVHLVIHHDPVLLHDSEWSAVRASLEEIVAAIDGQITLHSFRLVRSHGESRVVFDLAVPYAMEHQRDALRKTITDAMVSRGISHPLVIRFDAQG